MGGSVLFFYQNIKIGCYEKMNNDPYYTQIDHLFNKIFKLCADVKKEQDKSSKLIALDPSFSKESLDLTLNPLFVKNLLEKTRKEEIRSCLEQDSCCGEYWKELHSKSNTILSLQNLQKLHFCLENVPSNIQNIIL